MRKAAIPKIEFEYEDSKENEEIVQNMYNKIFDLARRNVLEKRKINMKSENQTKLMLPVSVDNTENISVNH
jgi:hypothetical protein